MDYVITLVSSILGSNSQLLFLFLVFGSTLLVTGSIAYWLSSGESAVDRRLRTIAEGELRSIHSSHREGSFNVKWIEPVAKLIEPESDWKKSRIKRKLVRAGYRDPKSVRIYLATKVLLAFSIPILFVIPFLILNPLVIGDRYAVVLLVVSGLFGFYFPDLVLHNKAEERSRSFADGFPDAMDMLVVCVEAGLGLDAAIQRVGNEIMLPHPELGTEMRIVSLELRAGKSREEALRDLSERTGVEEVKSLTSLLIQAEHFGTSIASALREHATEMRTLRIQNAREKAAKLPVKLIFPILFFIFPALFLVILGPAMVNIYINILNRGG